MPDKDYSHRSVVQKLGVRPDERVEIAGDVGTGLRGDVKEALGRGLVRSRTAALVLLGLLVVGNFTTLALLIAGLVTARAADLTGGELLFTAFAMWTTDVIVFGLLFWEVEAGGPAARLRAPARTTPDFQFPQDASSQLAPTEWSPQVWDYLYVSLTNSIAFSPTDAMPLSLRAKAMMGVESAISAVLVVLVAARAVNILAS